MLTIGIVIASLVAYFAAGWALMTWDMPSLWERARAAHPAHSFSRLLAVEESKWATSHVHSGAATTLLLWPFRLPFLLAMHSAVKHDPKRLQAELAAQQTRIAELERELRIGRRS